ncbi:hypothetical protein E2562_015709 [Oryza meyeriana var. granulata]|uniref:beta-galactosidase n=1 Tax=Oryza meyeriana var. granulata TaxID=110450 RepID=A0A6G1D468_9ORYZ|nr:hypothetical protein E2562_015709 [Oryza meyeriana var. granulata]
MWPDLIQKAKDGGLDVVQTRSGFMRSRTSFSLRRGRMPFGEDQEEQRCCQVQGPLLEILLVHFIKLVKQAGLYVNLHIGPYVYAEWNFGGFPVWLKYVPGISFRTDNELFKARIL